MGEPARQPDPSALFAEAMSQAVAQAMVPIRQEINAGLHNLERRMSGLEERMDRVEAKLDQILEKLG